MNQEPASTSKSVGKALKRIFHQDDALRKIVEQPASKSLLMNPVRLSIFVHLCQNPCGHTRSITRAVGQSLTGTNWHLGQLLEAGYVESLELGTRKLYWPAGMVLPDDIGLVALVREPWAIRIMKLVSSAAGGARQKDIVQTLGEMQQKVNVWLGRMVDAGLLEKHGSGMKSRYFVAPELWGAVIFYDEKAKFYSRSLLALLNRDGLMPSKPRFKGSRMGVDVKLPAEKVRLHLECNPLAPIRGLALQP